RNGFDRRAADLGLEPFRRALRDDAAVVDDPDAIGEDVGLLQILRDQEHRNALVLRQPADLPPQRRAALDVEPGRRLVEQQDARAVHERQREVEAALHPTGIGADLAVRSLGQADAREQLVAAALTFVAGDAVHRRLQAELLTTG